MQSAAKPATLLIVDDDASMTRLLRKIIADAFGERLSIDALSSPSAASDYIESRGVDLLLTDLDMPDLNGVELLRIAKRRSIATQVLFLTGKSTRESLLEALEFGACDYLLKPVRKDALIDRISEAESRMRRWQMALADTWRQQRIAEPVVEA